MTSLYLVLTTAMTSHPPAAVLSTMSLPSLAVTSSVSGDLESNIRAFWGDFPCPPPWRPRLLLDVNTSSLDDRVTRNVRAFLAGKCHIAHLLDRNSQLDGDIRFSFGDVSSGSDEVDLADVGVPGKTRH